MTTCGPRFQSSVLPLRTFASDYLAVLKCDLHVVRFPLCLKHLPSDLPWFPDLTLTTAILAICHGPLVSSSDVHSCVPPKQGPHFSPSLCREPNTAPGREAAKLPSVKGLDFSYLCFLVSLSLCPFVLVPLISTATPQQAGPLLLSLSHCIMLVPPSRL